MITALVDALVGIALALALLSLALLVRLLIVRQQARHQRARQQQESQRRLEATAPAATSAEDKLLVMSLPENVRTSRVDDDMSVWTVQTLTAQREILGQQCQRLLHTIRTVIHFQSPEGNRRTEARRRQDRGEPDRRSTERRTAAWRDTAQSDTVRSDAPLSKDVEERGLRVLESRYERRAQERRRGMDQRRHEERRLPSAERLKALYHELASAVERYEQLTAARPPGRW